MGGSERVTRSELRVMTVDVARYRGDVEALTATVRQAEPDVVTVLGAPRSLRWRSKRAELARRCGLVVATADRPGGLLIMTSLRAAVVDTSLALLPLSSRGRRRCVVSAVVDTLGTRWRVAATQLGQDAGERAAHSGPLQSALFAVGPSAPLIVAGDLAESSDGPIQAALRDRLAKCAAADGLVILADPALAVVSASSRSPLAAVLAQS